MEKKKLLGSEKTSHIIAV